MMARNRSEKMRFAAAASTSASALLFGLVALTAAAPASAADLATEYAACTADQMIDAERLQHCDAAIAFGELKGRRLAIVLDHRGVVRARLKDFAGALADLDAAARQYPDLPETYWYRGAVHHAANDLERALADLDRAVALAPANAQFRLFRARIHADRKDFPRAIADVTATIEQGPRFDGQYVLRAMIHEEAGEREKAIADYKTALQMAPDNPLVRSALKRLGADAATRDLPPGQCSADGITNEARAAACTAEIASGTLTDAQRDTAYCNLGYALTEMSQYDRVIETSDTAIRLNARSACAHLNRGRAWYYKHALDRAVADYNETIRLDSTFHEAYANRGTVYHDQRDYARAVADYDAAIAIESDQPMYYSDRGNTRYLMGDYQSAIADQTRAIEAEPTYLKAYVRRGWAYLEIGSFAQAEADFAKVLEWAPGDATAEAGLRRAREYREHPEYAADDREEAKGLNFDHFRRMVEKSQAPRR
jgi:tetratricopeptide (TPR) repeat protein